MSKMKNYLTFLIGLSIGFFAYLKLNSNHSIVLNENNEKINSKDTISSIVKNSDFYSMKYSEFIVPEIKAKIMNDSDDKTKSLIQSEDFWNKFKSNNHGKINQIDSDYILALEKSISNFPPKSLEKFNDYLNMAAVVKIKGRINLYMKNDYFKEINNYQSKVEELVLTVLNKQNEKKNGQENIQQH